MCGIAGILNTPDASQSVSTELLGRMTDVMAHRGPDGSGLWVSDGRDIGLAHRRLAIIDLSDTAAQPMHDGSLVLSFNGEIYNHAELRRELIALGFSDWQTDHSDTEVILKAYRAWGIDCIHRFRGIFAFALWDGGRRELWLVRDRIGVKPLYYTLQDGRLLFASEIKALLTQPGMRRAVNEQALYHYLSFHATPAPMTLFEGIHKLQAGTWMRVDATGKVQHSRYWDVWDTAADRGIATVEEAAALVRAELETAVSYRAVSDVPVGIFLSGGIDSSTNAALFSRLGGGTVKTFSIGYDGDFPSYRNEFDSAQLVANTIGSEHHERRLSLDDLIAFLPDMVWHQDEPLADPVCVPVYYVSQMARSQGVVVAQVGEGADELFWGYPAWKTLLRIQQLGDLPVPRFAKSLLLKGAELGGRGHWRSMELLRRNVSGQRVFWGGFERFSESQKARLLSPGLRQRLAGLSSWHALEPIWNDFRSNAWEPSALHWMSYLDLKYRLPELLLMRVDKMSMATSLEARVPFLDHRFSELAMSIPARLKTRGGELKTVLKHAVRGLIPDQIIDRRKQGFGVPVQEFLLDRLGPLVERELLDMCARTDYFDTAEVRRLIEHRDSGALWTLLNFSLWWRRYIADEELSLG